jgi:hypothetical protein
MGIDSATWESVFKLFDPHARLELADRDLFVRRPGSVAEAIAKNLNLGLAPEGKWVVCGSMGSGKSSELVHLGNELQASRIVIGLDLPSTVARPDLLKPAEVIFLIGAAAVKVAESWGKRIDKKLLGQLTAAFQNLLAHRGHTVNLGDVIQGVTLLAVNALAPGAAAIAGLATGAARAVTGVLGDKGQVRTVNGLAGLTRPLREGEPDLEQLREAVDDILGAITNEHPPVVLVDGLDKIDSPGAILDMFTATRILCLPRAQVVYTAPITLMISPFWQPTGTNFKRERLTNVAISAPQVEWATLAPDKITEGRTALHDVVRRRLRRLDIDEAEAFPEDSLERLIDASGGVLRDLIQLVNRSVQIALLQQATRIDAAIVKSAIVEYRKEYAITLNTQRVTELVHVRKEGQPTGSDVSAQLLLTGYILPYTNGDVWFDRHPILAGARPGL